MRPAPVKSGALNLLDEVRAIRENERIVITNALDEEFRDVEPRDYPGIFVDASLRLDNFKYTVCYAVQRRAVKPNYLFFPMAAASIKEKTRTPQWFAATGAQLIAYYNYQVEEVWVMRTQALRELSPMVNNEIKEYIPHVNTKVYGFVIPYDELEIAIVKSIHVSDEKHQLGIALAQSLYF